MDGQDRKIAETFGDFGENADNTLVFTEQNATFKVATSNRFFNYNERYWDSRVPIRPMARFPRYRYYDGAMYKRMKGELEAVPHLSSSEESDMVSDINHSHNQPANLSQVFERFFFFGQYLKSVEIY